MTKCKLPSLKGARILNSGLRLILSPWAWGETYERRSLLFLCQNLSVSCTSSHTDFCTGELGK
jgi:hypothetical protein